jgi:hypothetical protein
MMQIEIAFLPGGQGFSGGRNGRRRALCEGSGGGNAGKE